MGLQPIGQQFQRRVVAPHLDLAAEPPELVHQAETEGIEIVEK